MIAIAIIGILAAIVIPTYQGSVRKANEASAVAALNTIKLAQAKYTIDHKGEYGTSNNYTLKAILISDSMPISQ